MAPNGVVRQLGVEAAPYQELPGAVARAVVRERGEALREEALSRCQLVRAAALGERRLDQLGGYATARQVLLDPLGSPAVQRAPVLGEPLRIPGVIEDVRALELADHLVDQPGLDPLALEIGPQLGGRPVANRQRPAGDVEGPAELLLGSAQAACSSGGSLGSAAGGICATVASPCEMPVAS
jgi:hypothetical protein